MKRHSLMGTQVKDLITGVTGMVTAVTQYITGCDQLLVSVPPDPEKPNVMPDSIWLDDSRLVRIGKDKLVLEVEGPDAAKPKGFGPPAPIK